MVVDTMVLNESESNKTHNAQTPTDKILAQKKTSNLPEHVVDEDKRVFKLRVPEALDEFDLTAALGPEFSGNPGLVGMTGPLLYIESIDGVPLTMPSNIPEIRAAIKRVGSSGLRLVSKAVGDYYAAEQKARAGNISEIKNS